MLAPTRELAQQIAQQLVDFSQQNRALKVVCVFGGASVQQQIKQIRQGAHIIVATPGRLIDLAQRNVVRMSSGRNTQRRDQAVNVNAEHAVSPMSWTPYWRQTPDEKLTWRFSCYHAC
ncbi:MAG: DEAD/DEAH box helicase [Owenweeksia sp.]|nr:DEAD/DEAH box helicase [Owenweeksia sp.]